MAVSDASPVADFACFEVAAALTWTRQAATTQLHLADTIVRRFPTVHAAMSTGDLDLPKARIIADGVSTLDLPQAHAVVAAILPVAPTLTTGQLQARLAKFIIETDPSGAATRHRRRTRDRRVVLQPTEDSTAALFGLHLPADTALAASDHLTATAHSLKQGGDPRTLDQLRADIFLNRLLGNAGKRAADSTSSDVRSTTGNRAPHDVGTPGNSTPADRVNDDDRRAGSGRASSTTGDDGRAGCRAAGGAIGDGDSRTAGGRAASGGSGVRGGVELVATLETLTRLANQPGHLNGYGPVIADIARQVASQQRRSPWSFTIRDEDTGHIFTGVTRRRPSAALARHVRSRDRTCRAPGCRRPADRADLDHTVAVEHGGRTTAGNLGPLCRFHHRGKHKGRWTLRQAKPGIFEWRSPLGRRYTVTPEAP